MRTRILLIEDDQQLRTALRLNLVASAYEVVEAADGRAGLAAFKAQAADVVITDMFMPEADGVETIQAIRGLNPRVAIIAITGDGFMGPARSFLHMAKLVGATEVLAKPIEIDELLAVLARFLEPSAGFAAG
jgi:CheY-like chemotaxis protein